MAKKIEAAIDQGSGALRLKVDRENIDFLILQLTLLRDKMDATTTLKSKKKTMNEVNKDFKELKKFKFVLN